MTRNQAKKMISNDKVLNFIEIIMIDFCLIFWDEGTSWKDDRYVEKETFNHQLIKSYWQNQANCMTQKENVQLKTSELIVKLLIIAAQRAAEWGMFLNTIKKT